MGRESMLADGSSDAARLVPREGEAATEAAAEVSEVVVVVVVVAVAGARTTW